MMILGGPADAQRSSGARAAAPGAIRSPARPITRPIAMPRAQPTSPALALPSVGGVGGRYRAAERAGASIGDRRSCIAGADRAAVAAAIDAVLRGRGRHAQSRTQLRQAERSRRRWQDAGRLHGLLGCRHAHDEDPVARGVQPHGARGHDIRTLKVRSAARRSAAGRNRRGDQPRLTDWVAARRSITWVTMTMVASAAPVRSVHTPGNTRQMPPAVSRARCQ
jgi:hypothetical protein